MYSNIINIMKEMSKTDEVGWNTAEQLSQVFLKSSAIRVARRTLSLMRTVEFLTLVPCAYKTQ